MRSGRPRALAFPLADEVGDRSAVSSLMRTNEMPMPRASLRTTVPKTEMGFDSPTRSSSIVSRSFVSTAAAVRSNTPPPPMLTISAGKRSAPCSRRTCTGRVFWMRACLRRSVVWPFCSSFIDCGSNVRPRRTLVGGLSPQLDVADVVGPIPHAAHSPRHVVPHVQLRGASLRKDRDDDEDDDHVERDAERIPKTGRGRRLGLAAQRRRLEILAALGLLAYGLIIDRRQIRLRRGCAKCGLWREGLDRWRYRAARRIFGMASQKPLDLLPRIVAQFEKVGGHLVPCVLTQALLRPHLDEPSRRGFDAAHVEGREENCALPHFAWERGDETVRVQTRGFAHQVHAEFGVTHGDVDGKRQCCR